MAEKIMLIITIVFAVMAVQTEKLRRAVVYLAVFSITSSVCYLFMGCPDVAIAEAVIGSSLATIIYLVALSRYRVFTVYYINDDIKRINDRHLAKRRNTVLGTVENFCYSRELEPQVIYTVHEFDEVVEHSEYDLIIRQTGKDVLFYGRKRNYHIKALNDYVHSQRNVFTKNNIEAKVWIE